MSLRRKRRRKQEQRRYHDAQQPTPQDAALEVDDAPGWTGAPHELEAVFGAALQLLNDKAGEEAPQTARSSSGSVREAEAVRRLAYTRRQAAEALGVSVSTIDRRVVPSIATVKTPWGQRLIPVDELERFMSNHIVPPESRPQPARRPAGRPSTLPPSVVDRICLDYARGRGFAEIARSLTSEGISTAHGGRKWWPSTVRAVLVRTS